MTIDDQIHIFAGSSGHPFAERMCCYLGIELSETRVIKFSEGNTFVKIGQNVRGKEVYLVQPIAISPNDEFVELLFWMDAFKRSGAKYVTAIIPYFSYAKGDKKDEPRVSIRARVCAECIELAGADRVITLDLHAPQIQGFFKKPVDHLLASPLLCEFIKRMHLVDAVIVAPDAGFGKNARKFANYLGLSVAIGDKVRHSHNEQAEILTIIGDVEGKTAVIVDDFTISGGTLISTAQALKKHGAKHIHACLSHTLLNETNLKRIESSPIETIITTDSVENPVIRHSPKFRIISVAPLFAEAVLRTQKLQPISDLFEGVPQPIIEASFAEISCD